MICDNAMNSGYLCPAKSPASLEPNWIKPEFRYLIITLDMHVLRLIAITRIEKEPIRANSQYSRHKRKVLG